MLTVFQLSGFCTYKPAHILGSRSAHKYSSRLARTKPARYSRQWSSVFGGTSTLTLVPLNKVRLIPLCPLRAKELSWNVLAKKPLFVPNQTSLNSQNKTLPHSYQNCVFNRRQDSTGGKQSQKRSRTVTRNKQGTSK